MLDDDAETLLTTSEIVIKIIYYNERLSTKYLYNEYEIVSR